MERDLLVCDLLLKLFLVFVQSKNKNKKIKGKRGRESKYCSKKLVAFLFFLKKKKILVGARKSRKYRG